MTKKEIPMDQPTKNLDHNSGGGADEEVPSFDQGNDESFDIVKIVGTMPESPATATTTSNESSSPMAQDGVANSKGTTTAGTESADDKDASAAGTAGTNGSTDVSSKSGRSRNCWLIASIISLLLVSAGVVLGIYFGGPRAADGSWTFALSAVETDTPSEVPSASPSTPPSTPPSLEPSSAPSESPSETPSENPSAKDTMSPSASPSLTPSDRPSPSPTDRPTPLPTEAYYPQNPVPQDPPRGYFNYDPDSEYGPRNWHRVSTSDHWLREFSNDGFGPWAGWHSDDLTENRCAFPDRNQSPKDMVETIPCDAEHEIRTRCAVAPLANDEYMEKLILPHKLSIEFKRRSCIDNLNEGSPCLVDQPPMADYPRYASGELNILAYSDMHHFDIKIPGEHTLQGESFDAELQMFHTSLATPRLNSIGIPVRADDGLDNEEFQVILNEFQAVYDLHAMECGQRRMRERKLEISHASSSLRGGAGIQNEYGEYDHYDEVEIEDKLAFYEESIRNITEIRNLQHFLNNFNPYSDAFMTTMFFYRYDGSITEPPCRDITWWVIKDPMRISRRQLSQMKRILFSHVDSNCQPTSVHNANQESTRPIFPLGSDRDIQFCDDGSFRSDADKGRPPGNWCPN